MPEMNDKHEKIMSEVCELCHYPFVVANEGVMEAICENCPVIELLEDIEKECVKNGDQ